MGKGSMRGPDFREFLGVRQFQGGQRTSCHQIKKGVEMSIIFGIQTHDLCR
jgi:hypothetical protein